MSVFTLKQFKKEKLDSISPTMCLAKWEQATILLHTGMTHSCHHTPMHIITDDDLRGVSGLHNTSQKIKERQNLLNGVQTPECNYCWRIENLNAEHISDRVHKSQNIRMASHFDDIVKSGVGEDYTPSIIEVSFSNACNLRCIYCSQFSSSRWIEDIRKNGPYVLANNVLAHKPINRIIDDEHNPYVEAFWNWWPELYPKLHTFRITGGEPLLSKHTFAILDWIIDNPRKDLILMINSNLSVPDKIIDTFIEKLKIAQSLVKDIVIYTSYEAVGAQAEYIRDGLNYSALISNIRRILTTCENVSVGISTTISNLSMPSFVEFLKSVDEINNEKLNKKPISMSLNYLRNPAFLDIRNMPVGLKAKYSDEIMQYARTLTHDIKKDKIVRLVSYMNSEELAPELMDDFKLYINQFDKRRGLNFKETFPELVEMLEM